jgi:guanine nucleotide exchange factor
MAFENISFTKSVSSTSEGGAPKKLLACAECDLGPLGMTIGTDYWLLANRVAYKT